MFCGCGCVWFSLRKKGEKKGEAFCTVHTHKRSQPTSRHTFFMALAYWKPMKQWSPLMPFRRCLNALFQYARAISKFTNIDTHQFYLHKVITWSWRWTFSWSIYISTWSISHSCSNHVVWTDEPAAFIDIEGSGSVVQNLNHAPAKLEAQRLFRGCIKHLANN